jgi:hypothetical protein
MAYMAAMAAARVLDKQEEACRAAIRAADARAEFAQARHAGHDTTKRAGYRAMNFCLESWNVAGEVSEAAMAAARDAMNLLDQTQNDAAKAKQHYLDMCEENGLDVDQAEAVVKVHMKAMKEARTTTKKVAAVAGAMKAMEAMKAMDAKAKTTAEPAKGSVMKKAKGFADDGPAKGSVMKTAKAKSKMKVIKARTTKKVAAEQAKGSVWKEMKAAAAPAKGSVMKAKGRGCP